MSVPTASAARPPMSPTDRRVIIGALAGAALCVFAGSARAEALLTLSRGPDDAQAIELLAEDLAKLPQVTIVTENAFVDGEVAYTGPLVRDVIDHLGLGAAELFRFTAANDYSIEIPASDFRNYDTIFAMEADGRKLSRREKGPLWLMYPISDNEELRDPIYVHRLIWQVVRIEPL